MNELTPNNEAEAGPGTIADQKRPVRILTAFLQKDTIPHALLFTGIEGVGKKRIATVFAMAANCDRQGPPAGAADGPAGLQPCGVCRSCRKIEKGIHPDIHCVQPQGRMIRIGQIRALIETLTLKPMEARRRFVIIQRADTMKPAAANALLKTLEEPPERTILILLAGQPADLLPTIVSRCRHVRFHPVSTRSIADRLVSAHGVSPADASLAAAAAGGSFTRALAMAGSGWTAWRNWVLTASGLQQPHRLGEKPLGELLAFAELLAKDKGRTAEALETMAGWLRDLIVVRHDAGKVINADRIDGLQQLCRQLPTAALLAKIDAICQAQRSIESNCNLRLTLEAMVLRLAQDYANEKSLNGN